MRLAIITATPPSVAEGSGTHVAVEELVRGLQSEGHAATLIRPRPSRLPTSTLRRFQFNWSLTEPLGMDLIVGFDMDGYRLAGHTTAPFVAYLHGVIADELRFDRGMDPFLRGFEARAEAASARRARLVLVTSEYSRRQVKSLYGIADDRIGIAPPPVTLAGWQREVSTATHAPHAPVVLSVAHWYPRKNLKTIVRTAGLVAQTLPDVEFRIAGHGPDVAAGQRLTAALGLEKTVRFLGHVRRSLLAREHANADVFFLPSRQEGFGLAVVEAMAVGLPVVALEAGATPELVTHETSGLLTADDPVLLAQAIVRILSHAGLRARFGEAARLNTVQWDGLRSIQRFLEVVRPALARA